MITQSGKQTDAVTPPDAWTNTILEAGEWVYNPISGRYEQTMEEHHQ